MKHKDIPVLAFLTFLYLLVSSVAAELFTVLLIRFVILFVELDFLAASLIRMVSLFAISMGLFGFLGYKESYRTACFTLSEVLPATALASLAHVLICLPTRFSPWIAGATRHVAGFLSLGEAYNATERIEEISFGWLVASGLLMAALLSGGYLLLSWIGFRHRIRDRAELTNSQ